MKIFKKILKIISTIILSILCVVITFLLIYVARIAYLTSQNRLGDLKTNFYTIVSQSMYPKIKAGDIVVTYKNSDNDYKVGDVITFISHGDGVSGVTITHRIVGVEEKEEKLYYKTKGDNNNVEDTNLVPAHNVFGKVIFKIPKVGSVQQFLVTKTGWVTIIILPCVALVIYNILKFFRIFKRKKELEEEKNKHNSYGNNIIDDENIISSDDILPDERIVIPLEDNNSFIEEIDEDSVYNIDVDKDEDKKDDIELL